MELGMQDLVWEGMIVRKGLKLGSISKCLHFTASNCSVHCMHGRLPILYFIILVIMFYVSFRCNPLLLVMLTGLSLSLYREVLLLRLCKSFDIIIACVASILSDCMAI